MEPVIIDLSGNRNVSNHVLPVMGMVIIVSAILLSVINVHNFFSNKEVIRACETRIKQYRKQFENKELKTEQKEIDYLLSIIKKDLSPLIMVLTAMEECKPDRLIINELSFSESSEKIYLKGETNQVKSTSRFLTNLEKTDHFNVMLISQRVTDRQTLIFELNAEWK